MLPSLSPTALCLLTLVNSEGGLFVLELEGNQELNELHFDGHVARQQKRGVCNRQIALYSYQEHELR